MTDPLRALPAAVLAAAERIRPHVRRTPVEPSPALGDDVHVKLECFQVTGSFKVRGAMNRLLSMDAATRARGVVVASTGNHGAATAYGCQRLGCPGVVFAPEDADPSKLSAIAERGLEVHLAGSDCLESELRARAHAEERGMTYVSPYNDVDVVAGQGTLGVELAEQVEGLERAYVAVGGGGLVAGVAAHLKAVLPGVEVVGCSPRRSAVMALSVGPGRIVEVPWEETLSDGTAGGLEEDTVTLPLCSALVDRFVLVDEEEIAAAMRLVLERHRALVEGAAGVAVAACLREREEGVGRRAAVVLCGANVSVEKLARVLGTPG